MQLVKYKALQFLSLFFFIGLCTGVYAQDLVLSGTIESVKEQPLNMAAIYTKEKDKYTLSNTEGFFSLKLTKGKYLIVVSLLGYQTKEIEVDLLKNTNIKIVLNEETLTLKEVVVTAKQLANKEGTSVYKIEKQAIQQIQARSLGDILSLLPGNTFSMGNLNNVQQANLRSAAPSSSNAFGTAVIVDGVRLNNDANLQAKNPSSSFSAGTATVARGIDLRKISATGITSVEVISGIASPKYGNLASGAIIVKNAIGKQPFSLQTNITPLTYQVGVSQGWLLKKKLGVLNTDFSYLYSKGNATEKKQFYQNFNLGLRWQTQPLQSINWNNTASLQVYHSNDGLRHEPDEIYKNEIDVKSSQYIFSIYGDMEVLGKLSYNFNTSVTNQNSFFDTFMVNGPLPIIEALESGTYFSSYTPLTYNQTSHIKGKPVQHNLRVESLQTYRNKKFKFYFETGLQYSYDKNKGSGRSVLNNVAAIGNLLGNRSAKFNVIPASKTYSAYHQTKIKRQTTLGGQELRLGLRYDYMLERYNLLSPRVSFNTSIFKNLSFNAAWGISYKTPAMAQLYPGPSYIDYTNLNYFAENKDERLAVVTTYVHQPTNNHLKPSFSGLYEYGVSWSKNNFSANLTWYNKNLEKGVNHTSEVLVLNKQNYEVVDAPTGRQPTVKPTNTNSIIRNIGVLKNNYYATTKGLESTLHFPKIEAINTQFSFRMAHIQTKEIDKGYNLRISKYIIGDEKSRYGVYQNTQRTSYLSNASVTAVHHISSLGLVFTLSGELNFQDYEKRKQGSIYPYAYYDYKGDYYNIPKKEQSSEQYKNLWLNPRVYEVYEKPPFYTNFNLQIRKEIKNGHSFSFFANNFMWQNPTYEIMNNRRNLNTDLTIGFSTLFKF